MNLQKDDSYSCDFCSVLHNKRGNSVSRTQQDLFLLLHYKSQSCRECNVLISCLDKLSNLLPPVFEEDPRLTLFAQDNGALNITVSIKPRKNDAFVLHFGLYCSADPKRRAFMRQLGTTHTLPYPFPEISQDSRASSCVQKIKKWLNECDGSHRECRLGVPSSLPTRVIDIGPYWLPVMPKLIDTRGMKGQYVALSHPWGNSQTLTTTSGTLTQRYRGIRWSIIPKTYQDAIIVTRKLGLRYIWIDSLCIIQGDKKDWHFESAKMSDVYSNSYITIAANRATSCQSGFLGPRQGYGAEKIRKYGTNFKLRQIPEHLHPATREPLLQRAWPFQERILPKRVISFGEYEMKWQCVEAEMCECGYQWPEMQPSNNNVSLSRRERHYHTLVRQTRNVATDGSEVDRFSKIFSYWRTFVIPEYTELKLTHKSDRLPALSGIATGIKLMIHDTYLAGLWLKDFPNALAWKSTLDWESSSVYSWEFWPYKGFNSSNALSRGPSWSWVSVEAPIRYFSLRSPMVADLMPEILDASCDLVSSNPTGPVRGGLLKIRTYTWAAKFNISETGLDVSDPYPATRIEYGIIIFDNDGTTGVCKGHFHLDTPLVESRMPTDGEPSPTHNPTEQVQKTLCRSYYSPARTGYGFFHFLRLHCDVKLLYLGDTDTHIADQVFLVLAASAEAARCYQRIGIFEGKIYVKGSSLKIGEFGQKQIVTII